MAVSKAVKARALELLSGHRFEAVKAVLEGKIDEKKNSLAISSENDERNRGYIKALKWVQNLDKELGDDLRE